MTLVLIGFVGGLITGLSPCILPVLPVVFLGGGTPVASGGGAGDEDAAPVVSRARPFLVVLGLTLSFAVFTLFGSLLLSALHLPADLIRWIGIAALVLLGLGLIVPRIEQILEWPFRWIRQRRVSPDGNGFLLGIALGAMFVPCAGPVLAAIAVAGATGTIGWDTVALTLAFAVGCAIPLLVFALAGQQVITRIRAFRRHLRVVRIVSGAVMIALAVALAFNLADAIQRYIPNYTESLANGLAGELRSAEGEGVGAEIELSRCQGAAYANTPPRLKNCGPAPEFAGIEEWIGTPDGEPLTIAGLRGKVVLVDFWAYSCINCQRELPHVQAWYEAYADQGFVVVGVHTPEYAFERVPENVVAGAERIGLTFPIAIDNAYATWTAYDNFTWPESYLIDQSGTIRSVSSGEGYYEETEALIRQLLAEADPAVVLPAETQVTDRSPRNPLQTSEVYLGTLRARAFLGAPYGNGTATFEFPEPPAPNAYSLAGTWTADEESITAGDGARIRLSFNASHVYLDVGGTGVVTVIGVDGSTRSIEVSGPPNLIEVETLPAPTPSMIVVELSAGLSAYSFTFG